MTKKSEPITEAKIAMINRYLALIADHNEGRENLAELRKALEAEGVKFTHPTGTYKMRAAGITVTDTSGHANAVCSWANKARRALIRGGA